MKKGVIGTIAAVVVLAFLGAKTSADPVNPTATQPQTSNANPQIPPPPIVQNAGEPIRPATGCLAC